MRIRPTWGLCWLALIALVGCGSPVADGRSSQAEDFRVGPVVPPIPPQPPASASGCDDLAWDDERPTPIRRRVIAAPERPVPFFSRRVGVLPGDGPATVAGVRLPRGSRCPHYWATDAPVPDAIKLARRLAAAFPDTGLWPVLSNLPEDLDHYAIFTSDPARADRLDARAVLLAAWSEYLDAPERFPGLAPGSPGARAAADPFGTLARARTSESGWVLILVPAHRPADVISMVGSVATEVMPDEALTAVVRSWEGRFRAVVTTIGPGMLGLSVGAPPRSPDQALTLAAELTAFSPEDEEVMGPDDLPALARRLRSGPPDPTVQSRDFWEFGWPD